MPPNPKECEIHWPRDFIAREARRLLLTFPHGQNETGWKAPENQPVSMFLEEAFSNLKAVEEFNAFLNLNPSPEGTQFATETYLKWVIQNQANFPPPRKKVPYWSQRKKGEVQLDFHQVVRSFMREYRNFEKRGYLVEHFGQECVDGDTPGSLGEDLTDQISSIVGKDNIWPPELSYQYYNIDDLCDIIEFMHDHISRPTNRVMHSWNECGWHYSDFHAESGRQIYRWRINEIFNASSLRLSLQYDGRIEELAPSGLESLVEDSRKKASVHPPDQDEVIHALEQFRSRGASTMDRRQAVISLSGVLERRRGQLKSKLNRKDEGALFDIANNFGIRHQRADQRVDYDQDLYLEWIFYFYLATLNLTGKINERTNDS